MPYYEHVFIARQDINAQQVETMTKEFADILEAGGGRVAKNEYWGLKTLAYKIKKNRKGHYVLLNIDAPFPAVAEMERQARLHDDVLRFMTVRVDELEEGPSAVLRNRAEKDNRRGGRDRDRGERGDRDRGDRDRGDRDRGDRDRGDRGDREQRA